MPRRRPRPGPSTGDVWQAAAHGALLGACGNSGVIVSQLLRGLAEVCGPAAGATARCWPERLAHAAAAARAAVRRPVEGTVLTVADAAALAAARCLRVTGRGWSPPPPLAPARHWPGPGSSLTCWPPAASSTPELPGTASCLMRWQPRSPAAFPICMRCLRPAPARASHRLPPATGSGPAARLPERDGRPAGPAAARARRPATRSPTCSRRRPPRSTGCASGSTRWATRW